MRLGALARIMAVAVSVGPAVAGADPYDFKLYKLGNTYTGGTNASPTANAVYRTIVRELAAAVTAVNLMPPETLGHAAFAVQAELQVVDFGTPVVIGNQTATFPMEGEFKGPMLIPSLHLRKGLPFSFELGGRIGWIEKSRMPVGTLELKFALNEGFTYLPDIGVRGHITKIMNTRDFDLTAGGLDLGLGKQFAIGGMLTVTPYAGWNLVFVGSTTSNIDFNPTRSPADGEPGQAFRDIYTFEPVNAGANTHNRFYGGARLISGALMIAAEFSYTVIGSFTDKSTGITVAIPGVASFNSSVGLDF